MPNVRVPRAMSNQGPPVASVSVVAGPFGDEPGRRDVPGRQAVGLGEGVEPAGPDVGQGEGRRAQPAGHPDRVADRRQALGQARAVDRQGDDEVRHQVLRARPDRSPVEGRRAVGRGRERLAADGIQDDPDRRDAVDDEPDRDAEDRDAVRVVDRAVERVHDPHPAAPPRRLARLLRQSPIVREGLPDRVEDERLAQVVDLGHDVLGALVADRFDPPEPIDEELAGPGGQLRCERQLGRVAPGRHGPVHSTASGRTVLPSSVTSLENETVRPGSICGLTMNAASGPSPALPGS